MANENIFRSTVLELRSLGHDVRSVAEEFPGVDDSFVLRTAATDGRIVVTFDKDYGELIFRHGRPSPPGLILLRFDPINAAEVVALLQMLDSSPDVALEGWFTIVRRNGLRQRRMPN